MGLNIQAQTYLQTAEAAAHLGRLYGRGVRRMEAQRARYAALARAHVEKFGAQEICFVSAPGRTEIAGNHTDHNGGCVLAAAVDMDTIAACSPCAEDVVTLYSEGYARPFVVDLSDLRARADEKETSLALIRGVAARMRALGLKIGGLRATVASTVFRGSGLSSSAAFEVLICAMFDALYNDFSIDAKLRAKIAQYAENAYFGKPCGLMDQMASSVGGLVFIDFGSEEPAVRAMQFDFEAAGFVPAVVAVGGEHGNLTAEYASIPQEMRAVAEALGGRVLRDIAPAALEAAIPTLKGSVPDRAILRALHFHDENARVLAAAEALARGDAGAFFDQLVASGESSWKLLQNLYVPDSANQEMALSLELSRRMLAGKGAWRVHGGGFAGTILAFVPHAELDAYVRRMDAVFGAGAVTPLMIRAQGAAVIAYD